jgi:thiamine biosynthesis lipoprotein
MATRNNPFSKSMTRSSANKRDAICSEALVRDFFAFNTMNRISAWTDDAAVLNEAVRLCAHYEHLFSRTNPLSELAQLNAAKGKTVTVEKELASLIGDALSYCEKSKGLFDITMGTVVRLWDFKKGCMPLENQLTDALSHVGYQKVLVKDNAVQILDPLTTLDLGGIAKGYIADCLISVLADNGIKSALVNLGGNVAVLGSRPDGTAWRVGLRQPIFSSLQPTETSFAFIEVSDCSVVTSGTYERAFVHNNAIYHHILDPKTGLPAKTDLLSATVIAKRSVDADGYTTALIIMGLDAALAFVEDCPNIEAVFVTNEGKVYASTGIADCVVRR